MWRHVLVRLAILASLPPLMQGGPDGPVWVGRHVITKPGATLRIDGRDVKPRRDQGSFTVEMARGAWLWVGSGDLHGWVRAEDVVPQEEAETLLPILNDGDAIRPLHVAMQPPKSGDWLSSHPEPGQTFDSYRKSSPNKPDHRRKILYIQPLGPIPMNRRGLLKDTAEFLGIFYGLPVKMLDPNDLSTLPARARRNPPNFGEAQVDSLTLLSLLKKNVPDDAVAVLGLTATDLWPNESGRSWNYVFGQASLRDRVGVWSVARLGDPELQADLLRLRTWKVAVHETGHMFGIWHCTAYECGMNGSNHLQESDRQPLAFCHECEMKVWWACGIDPAGRYERLSAFARTRGYNDEANAWERARDRVLSRKAEIPTKPSQPALGVNPGRS